MKKLLIFTLIFTYFSSFANAANPTLKIKQFDGNIFDLSKQKGKITLITFWAHWCHNCKREMPLLDKVYKKFNKKGFEVIAITIDRKNDLEKARNQAKKISYPTASQFQVIEASFSQPKFIPTYYLVGKNGKFLGEIFTDKNLTTSGLERILQEKLEN